MCHVSLLYQLISGLAIFEANLTGLFKERGKLKHRSNKDPTEVNKKRIINKEIFV